ncbi:hypothetical protein, partial [Bifidobacterium saguini]|uniref:hypothetical protein n=1 Tax=Bifidobacterium saguini TaxID=762210 RepID=UPI001ED99DB3
GQDTRGPRQSRQRSRPGAFRAAGTAAKTQVFLTLFGLLNRTRAAGSVNADAQRAPAGPGASSL